MNKCYKTIVPLSSSPDYHDCKIIAQYDIKLFWQFTCTKSELLVTVKKQNLPKYKCDRALKWDLSRSNERPLPNEQEQTDCVMHASGDPPEPWWRESFGHCTCNKINK